MGKGERGVPRPHIGEADDEPRYGVMPIDQTCYHYIVLIICGHLAKTGEMKLPTNQ